MLYILSRSLYTHEFMSVLCYLLLFVSFVIWTAAYLGASFMLIKSFKFSHWVYNFVGWTLHVVMKMEFLFPNLYVFQLYDYAFQVNNFLGNNFMNDMHEWFLMIPLWDNTVGVPYFLIDLYIGWFYCPAKFSSLKLRWIGISLEANHQKLWPRGSTLLPTSLEIAS